MVTRTNDLVMKEASTIADLNIKLFCTSELTSSQVLQTSELSLFGTINFCP